MATSTVTSAQTPSKSLHIVLWILQVLLAGVFGLAGTLKLITPIAELGAQMAWVSDLPLLVRFIGFCEVLGAIGLIVPPLTKIKPNLVVWAAYGLTMIMILAAIFHAVRGEYTSIVSNLIIGAIAFFVAWGRSKKVPFQPRRVL